MGSMHPEVVHFAIALVFVGVALRALSLLTVARTRLPFIAPSAVLLIVLGTIALAVAAYTGEAGHRPVEAMPGLRGVVTSHEDWGERSRNVFFVVLVIEVIALAMRASPRERYALIASTVVGIAGLGAVYEAGRYGGEIVYAYAGGVGIRSGNPDDVKRLLLAGLYQQALVERQSGRRDRAYALMTQAATEFPNDIEVQMMLAESELLDRADAGRALARLQTIHPPKDDRFIRTRHATLTADALLATGQREGALAVLQQAAMDVPSPRLQQKIDQIKNGR
ncbi:MAG TPA: DUF2231 domain-containing protein [Vicinamibacterales bacterium]|jgi:uncharacterized membrane protein|nr:DUF2231 domain-containing protein [Vicinamibacterales bacterium]